MKKAKDLPELNSFFNELKTKILTKLKEEAIDLVEDIDFDKIWVLIERRIDKCKERKAKRRARKNN